MIDRRAFFSQLATSAAFVPPLVASVTAGPTEVPKPQICTREVGHDGPCNGFPGPQCNATKVFSDLIEVEVDAETFERLLTHPHCVRIPIHPIDVKRKMASAPLSCRIGNVLFFRQENTGPRAIIDDVTAHVARTIGDQVFQYRAHPERAVYAGLGHSWRWHNSGRNDLSKPQHCIAWVKAPPIDIGLRQSATPAALCLAESLIGFIVCNPGLKTVSFKELPLPIYGCGAVGAIARVVDGFEFIVRGIISYNPETLMQQFSFDICFEGVRAD